MITSNVDDVGTLATLAEQLLDHIIVLLRPMPIAPQAPPIDNIADKIDRLGFMIAKKIQKQFRLCGLGTEMHIRDKEGSEFSGLRSVGAHMVVPFNGNLI